MIRFWMKATFYNLLHIVRLKANEYEFVDILIKFNKA